MAAKWPNLRAPLQRGIFPYRDIDFTTSHRACWKRAPPSEATVLYYSGVFKTVHVLLFFVCALGGETFVLWMMVNYNYIERKAGSLYFVEKTADYLHTVDE